MAKYSIDGVKYEIDDSLDLQKTVDQIRTSPDHLSASNTIGRAISENTKGAITAVGDIAAALPGMIAGAGTSLTALARGEDTKTAKEAGRESAAYFNPLTHIDALAPDRESSSYQAIMRPFEMVPEGIGLIGKEVGEAVGDKELGEQFQQVGELGTDLLAAGAVGRGAVNYGTRLRENAYKAELDKKIEAYNNRLKQQQEEQANTVSMEDVTNFEPYSPYVPSAERPFKYGVEPTAGAAEFGIGRKSQAALREDQRSLSERFEEQHRQRTGLASTTEEFPFNTKAHENAVPFPLRQEVLNQPEVKAQIDSLRAEHQRLIETKAPAEQVAKLEKEFGDFMQQYGIKSPQDAIGLQRPLYEGTARQLPVEKTVRPSLAEPDRTSSAFSETPRIRLPRNQRGYIEVGLLTDGFKKTIEAVDKLGEPLRILAFSGVKDKSISHLDKTIQDFVRRNTSRDLSKPSTHYPKMLRLVATDKHGNPVGLAEFAPKGDYLESMWTYTVEGRQGRGIATALYDAVREMGNDVRASAAKTPQGRKMWEAFSRDTKVESDYRPVLPRKQRGSIKVDSEAKKFRDFANKNYPGIPEEVVKAAWDDLHNKKEPKFESKVGETKQEVLTSIPGIREALKDLIPTFKSFEEVVDSFKGLNDISGDIVSKGGRQYMSGAKLTARLYNHPFIKYYADISSVAQDSIRKNVDKLLFHKETGVISNFDNLKSREQTGLWSVIKKYEGKKDLTREELVAEGLNEKQIRVYELIRAATEIMYDAINSVRKNKLTRRPGYFPAKFIGDWYVKVHAADLTQPGKQNLIGLYSANNKWSINRVVKQLKNDHPEWTVSKINERRLYNHKKGSEHAWNVYGDLLQVLEKNDPRAAVLSEILKQYEAEQANYTAGLFQHLKAKKGIEGSTGKNPYKTDLQNSHDAFRAFSDYIQQGMEFVEIKRAQPTVTKMLDRDTLPNLENAQSYISQHWDRMRGINNQYAQAINDMTISLAHAFGISGGQVRSFASGMKTQVMLLMLGWNSTRFLLTQLAQPNQFLFQNMASVQARLGEIKPLQMSQAWAKGFNHLIKAQTSRSKMEASARTALEWAEENRIVEPRMFEDIKTDVEKHRDNLYTFISGQRAIRYSEEVARTQAFMTFYELLADKGLRGQENYRLAGDLTRHTMVDYRPFEKPLLYQNMGIIGDMISPLTTFKHNYYSQLAVQLAELKRAPWADKSKYMTPVIIALGMQQLLSGLMGIPGKEDADMIMGWIKEIEPDFPDLTQIILQSELPNYITHGISTLTGTDMSPSFAAASLIPERTSEFAPIPSKVADIVGSGINAVGKGTKSAALEFAQNLTPNTFQGFLERGMAKGDIVPDPKQQMRGKVSRSDSEWNARYLAMRGIEESKERTMLYKEKQDESIRGRKKTVLVEKAADALESGKSIEEYVQKASKYGMTPQQFSNAVQQLMIDRQTTEKQRFIGLPPKSLNQFYKYQHLQRYGK